MDKKPFIAKEQTYLSDDRKTTFTVYHPAILYEGEGYCYFPDEGTQTGLVEHDNEADALRNAEELYNHYINKKELIT